MSLLLKICVYYNKEVDTIMYYKVCLTVDTIIYYKVCLTVDTIMYYKVFLTVDTIILQSMSYGRYNYV